MSGYTHTTAAILLVAVTLAALVLVLAADRLPSPWQGRAANIGIGIAVGTILVVWLTALVEGPP